MYSLQQFKNTLYLLETPFTNNISGFMYMFIEILDDNKLNSKFLIHLVKRMDKYKHTFIEKFSLLEEIDFCYIKYCLENVFINLYIKNKELSPYEFFICDLKDGISEKLSVYINKIDFLFLSSAFYFSYNWDIPCEDYIAHIKDMEKFNALEMECYINIFKENQTIIL